VPFGNTGIMGDPLVKQELETLAANYSGRNKSAVGSQLLQVIRREFPSLTKAQQGELLRHLTRNPYATLDDPTGVTHERDTIQRGLQSTAPFGGGIM